MTSPARFPAWAWVLLGVLIGLPAGAGLGVALGVRFGPEDRFTIGVTLRTDTTAEQKDRIAAALPGRPAFRTREEAFAGAKEQFKDQPDILRSLRPEDARESYETVVHARAFDCGTEAAISRLPGVENVTVLQEPTKSNPAAYISCPT